MIESTRLMMRIPLAGSRISAESRRRPLDYDGLTSVRPRRDAQRNYKEKNWSKGRYPARQR